MVYVYRDWNTKNTDSADDVAHLCAQLGKPLLGLIIITEEALHGGRGSLCRREHNLA